MTGRIIGYDGFTKRGTIQPSDGAGLLEFESRDVRCGEPEPGTPVKFDMRVDINGNASARDIEVIDPAGPCPCGSGLPYSQCHAPEASVQEVRSSRSRY